MPLAAAWLGLHRPVRALETVLEGLALDPEDADLVRVKTQILSQFASKSSGGLSREKDVYDGWSSQGPFAEVTVMSAIIRADHLQAIGKFGAALSWCLRAVNLSPHDSSNLLRASNLLYRLGRVEDSRRILFRAVRLDKCASTHHQIRQISQELLDFPTARNVYEESLVLDPEYVPSSCALGHLFQDMGNLEDAEPLIQKALRIKPDPLVRLVLETALPPLYKSIAEMHERLQTLVSNFERMISEGVLIDPKDHVIPTIFYVPYQGLIDKKIAAMMGTICSSTSAPSRSIPSVATARRIRIGFLSKFFLPTYHRTIEHRHNSESFTRTL